MLSSASFVDASPDFQSAGSSHGSRVSAGGIRARLPAHVNSVPQCCCRSRRELLHAPPRRAHCRLSSPPCGGRWWPMRDASTKGDERKVMSRPFSRGSKCDPPNALVCPAVGTPTAVTPVALSTREPPLDLLTGDCSPTHSSVSSVQVASYDAKTCCSIVLAGTRFWLRNLAWDWHPKTAE